MFGGKVVVDEIAAVCRVTLEHLGEIFDDLGRVVLDVFVRHEPHIGGELVGGIFQASGRRQIINGDDCVAEFVIRGGVRGIDRRLGGIGDVFVGVGVEHGQEEVGELVAHSDSLIGRAPEGVRITALRPHQFDVVGKFQIAVDVLGHIFQYVTVLHERAALDRRGCGCVLI